jgi:urease accessory protein
MTTWSRHTLPYDGGAHGPGTGRLAVERVEGASAAVAIEARNPLKLLVPRMRGASVWAYVAGFGGGYVAGDRTRLELRVGAAARCFLGTQASTKVYRNPEGKPCGHTLEAEVGEGGLLVHSPDPVQCFADSEYDQRQVFQLGAGAGLALADAFTSGREARGERWAFRRFSSRNEVFSEGRRVFVDAVHLDPAEGALGGAHRMGRYNAVALLLLLGPAMRTAAESVLETSGAAPVLRRPPVVESASPVGDGAIFRMAAVSVEALTGALRRRMEPLRSALGGDPWAARW